MISGVQVCFHLSVKREFGGRQTDAHELTASDMHLQPLDAPFVPPVPRSKHSSLESECAPDIQMNPNLNITSPNPSLFGFGSLVAGVAGEALVINYCLSP